MNNLLIKSIFPCIVIFALAAACAPPPEFPVVPTISFNKIEAKTIEGLGAQDSLILYVNFEDGDGDIGIGKTETDFPFHAFDYVADSKDLLVTYGGTDYVPPFFIIQLNSRSNVYTSKTFFSDTDMRPSAYTCQDFNPQKFYSSPTKFVEDTFFIKKNPNHNNIYVDFYLKEDGAYNLLDWSKEFNNCDIAYNGRIPLFDSENLGKSISGTIRYAMVAGGFDIILKKDTFKLKVYLKDRAFHDSNVIETPDLTLDAISAN